MDLQKMKNPATPASVKPGQKNIQQANHTTTRPPRKWARVLSAFLAGRSFNRFEAERELRDHCLHSTVSRLQRMGIVVDRTSETVPGYMGIKCHVMRYRLSPTSVEAAQALLVESAEVSTCA